MNKEERESKLSDKSDKYNRINYKLENLKYELTDTFGPRGRKYNLLFLAIDSAQQQLKLDYDRYVRRIRIIDNSEEMRSLQKSLNREIKKNTELEKKIDEAKTSSGLFIDYVRKRIGI